MVLVSSMGCMSKVSRKKCLIEDSEVAREETGASDAKDDWNLIQFHGLQLRRVRKKKKRKAERKAYCHLNARRYFIKRK